MGKDAVLTLPYSNRSMLIETKFLQLLSRIQLDVFPYYESNPSVGAVLLVYSVRRITAEYLASANITR
jgi:hypothetical protein